MKRIPLRDRRGQVRAFALVDDQDFERVSQFRWCLHSKGYACRSPKSGMVLLHRFLMGLERGDPREVDHENLDKLDCRRGNMRVVTSAMNSQNVPSRGRSRFRGVRWHRGRQRWQGQAIVARRYRHAGFFDDEIAAAVAVNDLRLREMPGALPDPELVALGMA